MENLHKNGIDKFVRFAGVEMLSDFIKEMGIPQILREIGATEEMLPAINSTVPEGTYKYVSNDEIPEIPKECY